MGISKVLSTIERNVIKFIVRRAGVWSEILNRSVEDEVMRYYSDMARKAGDSWDHEKMSSMIDSMRTFRTDNIKFAFGHVLAALAIVLSVAAIVISILK